MWSNLVVPFLREVKNFFLEILFPKRCVVCNQEGQFLCADCHITLKRDQHLICINCQKPSIDGMTHPKCAAPHSADALWTMYDYHDPAVAKLLIAGKYFFLESLYQLLGQQIFPAVQSRFYRVIDNAILVPIPLHNQRLRWRGFNQAEVLCQSLATGLHLQTIKALKRIKNTKTQKDLKRVQRLKNVDGCFALNKKIDVHNQNILLVDDVTTTGSTLAEAAKVLKRNGAAKVYCLAVARD